MPASTHIEFAGTPADLIWKFPGENLDAYESLRVGENQEALFFKGGQILYTFTTGQHSLLPEDVAFLRELSGQIPGEPMVAHIYYIQKGIFLKKWGTSSPIAVEDPKYKIMLELRAYGTYTIRVQDATLLLNQLLSTRKHLNNDQLEAFMRPIIVTRLSDFIAEVVSNHQMSPVQISAYLEEASEAGKQKLDFTFAGYGVELLDFLIESINFDKDDPNFQAIQKILTDKFEIDTLGDQYESKKNLEIAFEAVRKDKPEQTSPKATSGDQDPAIRLNKLKALLDQGLISPEEYAQKRKEILDSI